MAEPCCPWLLPVCPDQVEGLDRPRCPLRLDAAASPVGLRLGEAASPVRLRLGVVASPVPNVLCAKTERASPVRMRQYGASLLSPDALSAHRASLTSPDALCAWSASSVPMPSASRQTFARASARRFLLYASICAWRDAGSGACPTRARGQPDGSKGLARGMRPNMEGRVWRLSLDTCFYTSRQNIHSSRATRSAALHLDRIYTHYVLVYI